MLTMAQACGEAPVPLVFYPGEDFDPSDVEDREIARMAMDIEVQSEVDRLRAENASLRARLGD